MENETHLSIVVGQVEHYPWADDMNKHSSTGFKFSVAGLMWSEQSLLMEAITNPPHTHTPL